MQHNCPNWCKAAAVQLFQMSKSIDILQQEAIVLLKQLIATPSFSKEEGATAELLTAYLAKHPVAVTRLQHNVVARSVHWDDNKPTLLLNSHHDTVKPNPQYTFDPFDPVEKNGRLYGLGSNDAGGALVSLLAVFLYFSERTDLAYNILFAATAEEEISGQGGIELLLPELGAVDCAIVGEPTLMQMAVAEKGLLVIDCVATGRAGHAAREEGENALYKAMQDIAWFQTYRFQKISDLLGPVKMSVTSIETPNKAHNMVPDTCNFVVDIRVNELYTHEEVLEAIRSNVHCTVKPRSTRLRSSGIALQHPLVQAGLKLNCSYYGSPTTSDKALMPFPSLKMGPGDSARSHTADEYIYLKEIEAGIALYIDLINNII